jgi:hypothetical protein
VERICAVARSADELSYADDVHSGLLLSVWVLHEGELRISLQARNLGELKEIVDALPVVLQMETRILERLRRLDDGLAEVLDLLLCRQLRAGEY